jgi:hypothetical protein
MRVLFILATTAVVAGGLIATIKVPNVRSSERVLASYRADPQTTLKRLETAIFKCVPDSAQSAVGVTFARPFIAPFYLEIAKLRMEGTPRDRIATHLQSWIPINHPKLLTDLPDKDFRELIGYLQTIGEDDVENCILSSTT